MGLETIAVAALAVGSLVSSNKARKETKAANRAQSRIENRKATRESQKQLREAQSKAAEIVSSSEAQGVGGSSAVQGGVSSLQTQSTNNISFINQIQEAQQQVQKRIEKSNLYRFQSQAYAQGASLVSQVSSDAKEAATAGGGGG